MKDTPNPAVWAPLRRSLFRDRWISSIISNVGSWMQDTAGAWLMTSLTTSPFLIALMQTAATLPVLVCGLFAGAMADVFDRRAIFGSYVGAGACLGNVSDGFSRQLGSR